MISITTLESKAIDGVLFDELPSSAFRNTPARLTRTATLDGGAVLDHRGFSDGDRSLKIEANVDETTADNIWYLHRNETLLHIACAEGFFTGSISEIQADGGRLKMTFLVKE
jgi:hypothetical protein